MTTGFVPAAIAACAVFMLAACGSANGSPPSASSTNHHQLNPRIRMTYRESRDFLRGSGWRPHETVRVRESTYPGGQLQVVRVRTSGKGEFRISVRVPTCDEFIISVRGRGSETARMRLGSNAPCY